MRAIDQIDNKTVVAVAVVAVLAVVVVATRGLAPEVSSPAGQAPVFEAVDELERIELMYPADRDGPELVVLDRRDDRWWLVRPVEARMSPRWATQFEDTFGAELATDDVVFDADRADEFGLDDEYVVRVALFGAGDDRPVRELLVGDEFEVGETGVRRTFVREAGDDRIRRARGGFGYLVRLPVEEYRTRRLMEVDPARIAALEWPGDGLEVGRDRSGWTSRGGDVEWSDRQIDEFVELVAGLRVQEWVSGISPEDAGLDGAPDVEIEVDDRRIWLEFGEVGDGGEVRYGRFSETEGIFTIPTATAGRLTRSD